jgi:hypothetical protein
MRSGRILLLLIGSGTLLGVAAACAPARPAQAAGVWIEVSPGTVTAGSQVHLRADCGDNSNPATVRSTAFPTITVHPQRTLLVADVLVRTSTPEGTHDVTLTCRTGSTATTTLLVLGRSTSDMTNGPHTGGGFLATGGGRTVRPAAWWFAAAGVVLLAVAVALPAVVALAGAGRRRGTPRPAAARRRSAHPGAGSQQLGASAARRR